VTRAALRDLVRAKILFDNGGISPSPAGLAGSVSDMLVFLSENPGSAQWLSNLLPPESASTVKTSNWYKNTTAQETEWLFSGSYFIQRQIEIAGLTFRNIPVTNINNFMISENPVPKKLFDTFLNENPQWKDQYTDYYEEEISLSNSEIYNLLYKETITGITWYAAQAFCDWLTERLPSSMSAMEVRLPTEDEWEIAVKFGINNAVVDMRDIWEWCLDPYAPLQFIKIPPSSVQLVKTSERLLRQKPSSSNQETRASLPADLSSPFVTFRPVIAEKTSK
jgi:hypothetical protein